jgi:hypothetical protein
VLLKSSNNIAYLSLIIALQLNLMMRMMMMMMMRVTYLRHANHLHVQTDQSAVLVVALKAVVMNVQRRRMIKPMPWLHRMLSSEL